eukprot:TRINITY_DN52876_c0_g1_i1.p1 TRINITY_DN52876_c0_g1~~TRINITY_DN52876_c0_g1_i1.p1  ORF type:complete len:177 (+),score=46.75 TRINITY_DN52876_c0_g1_i1:134-664(+)
MKRPSAHIRSKPAAAPPLKKVGKVKAGEKKIDSDQVSEGNKYVLLGMLAFGQGTQSAKAYASILGEYESADAATGSMSDELVKVMDYITGCFGSGTSDKVSKQMKQIRVKGLQQLTLCLKAAVSRNDVFRWQVLEAEEDRSKVAANFFKSKESGGKGINWLESDAFSDGLDLWIAV